MTTAPPQGVLEEYCAGIFRCVQELRRASAGWQRPEGKAKEKAASDVLAYAEPLLEDQALSRQPHNRVDLAASAAVLTAYLDVTEPAVAAYSPLPDDLDEARGHCRMAAAAARELLRSQGADEDGEGAAPIQLLSLGPDTAEIAHEIVGACHQAVETLARTCESLVQKTADTCDALLERAAEHAASLAEARAGASVTGNAPPPQDDEIRSQEVPRPGEERVDETPDGGARELLEKLMRERAGGEAAEESVNPFGKSPGGKVFFRLLQPQHRRVTRQLLAREPVDLTDLDLDELLVEWKAAIDSGLREARGSGRRTASREVLDLFQLSGKLNTERARVAALSARR